MPNKHITTKNKIYDCFTFYNELELLEVRLGILDEVVDKFVLIESTVTYTNQPKPLYFKRNQKRFQKFKDKIIHVIVEDTPNVSNPWFIEHYLMAAAKRGLIHSKPNDTILISNLDEIPDPKKILEYKEKPGNLKAFEQRFFYYFLNLASTNHKWVGTKMIKYKNFKKYFDAYIIRHSYNDVLIKNGGWHFSYMGGLQRIRDKIATGTHQEYNNNNYNTKEKILQSIIERKDAFNHGDKFGFIEIEELPIYIQNNRNKYSSMLLPEDKRSLFKKQHLFFLELKHLARIFFRSLRAEPIKTGKQTKINQNAVPTMGVING